MHTDVLVDFRIGAIGIQIMFSAFCCDNKSNSVAFWFGLFGEIEIFWG